MQTLIIHMASSSQRIGNVDRLLAMLPNPRIVPAIDGRDPQVLNQTQHRNGDLYIPRYPFALLPGEVGCFLSHRACWQQIVDEGWPAALIVEDDLAIDADALDPLLDLLERHQDPDAYIRIPPKNREVVTRVTDQEDNLKLFTPRIPGLQTTAQLVGRNAATRLLQASGVLDRPVDSFVQMHWITGQPVQTILPNGCSERKFEGAGSTVQKKSRGFFTKLVRDWKRGSYRAAVRRHPQT